MLRLLFNWNTINYVEKTTYLRNLDEDARQKMLDYMAVMVKDRVFRELIKTHNKIMNERNIIVLDLETTGLARTSRIVQLSFAIYDEDGTFIEIHDYIIKQEEGIKIPQDSINIHGITDEISKTSGHELKNAIDILCDRLKFATKIIGHNIDFDIGVLINELDRINNFECKNELENKIIWCTMKNTKHILQMKNVKGNLKSPKLSELYFYLFNKEMENQHNAKYDVLNTAACYFEFRRKEKQLDNMIEIINDVIK